MRKLNNSQIFDFALGLVVNNHDQTRTCRHHRFFVILPPPTRIQFRHPFRIEVNREDFGQFRDSKGANSCHKTLQHPTSVTLVRLSDLPQNPLISLVQAVGQLPYRTPHTRWETVAENLQLAGYPTKPASSDEN